MPLKGGMRKEKGEIGWRGECPVLHSFLFRRAIMTKNFGSIYVPQAYFSFLLSNFSFLIYLGYG